MVTKLFGPPEELQDSEGHSAHVYRWTILRKRALNVIVYHAEDAWSGQVQDCPRRFISVGVAKHGVGAPEDMADRVEWMVLIGKRPSDSEKRQAA